MYCLHKLPCVYLRMQWPNHRPEGLEPVQLHSREWFGSAVNQYPHQEQQGCAHQPTT